MEGARVLREPAQGNGLREGARLRLPLDVHRGGTTTILEDELIKTIEHAKTLFPSIREVSCETDPQIITTPQFRNLKGLVDRMSIGVQSFNDDLLKLSERYEKFGSGEQIFERLQYAQELFPPATST